VLRRRSRLVLVAPSPTQCRAAHDRWPADDLQHPTIGEISPDYPPDSAETRRVRNNRRVAPTELPGVVTVSATGPVGYPGYATNIAEYSSVGIGVVDVTAPGGDYFSATGTVQDAVLGRH
jgi:lantibiotic leader peptide-processing serine protease